jgi:hypothetical protein
LIGKDNDSQGKGSCESHICGGMNGGGHGKGPQCGGR